jgi:hypothetical protein
MADFMIHNHDKGDKTVGVLPPSNHNDILFGDNRHVCTFNIISTKARQADTFGKMEVFVMGKARRTLPPIEILERHFYYNAETGVFVNKINKSSNARKTQKAGVIRPDGYVHLAINNDVYYAHRIAWSMFYREAPPPIIDHIDRNPSNNRISNLRAVSMSLNMLNTGNASIRRRGQKWAARIKVDYKERYLGTFKTKNEAINAYNDAKNEVFANA